jgi:hypothetical protein
MSEQDLCVASPVIRELLTDRRKADSTIGSNNNPLVLDIEGGDLEALLTFHFNRL